MSEEIEALRQQLTELESRLGEKIGTVSGRVRDHDILLAGQETTTAKVAQLSELVADLAVKVAAQKPGGDHAPHINPRWWRLTDAEKAAEVGRIRGWVNAIAKPWLGAGSLPECVYEHDYALTLLDAACEMWGQLWLPERRTSTMAAAQCEYLTRVWPGIRAEVLREVNGCDHQMMGAYPRVAS